MVEKQCPLATSNSLYDCGKRWDSNVHMDTRIFVPWSWWCGYNALMMHGEAVVRSQTGSLLPSDHSVEKKLMWVYVKWHEVFWESFTVIMIPYFSRIHGNKTQYIKVHGEWHTVRKLLGVTQGLAPIYHTLKKEKVALVPSKSAYSLHCLQLPGSYKMNTNE